MKSMLIDIRTFYNHNNTYLLHYSYISKYYENFHTSYKLEIFKFKKIKRFLI